jgi:hypothetical protein
VTFRACATDVSIERCPPGLRVLVALHSRRARLDEVLTVQTGGRAFPTSRAGSTSGSVPRCSSITSASTKSMPTGGGGALVSWPTVTARRYWCTGQIRRRSSLTSRRHVYHHGALPLPPHHPHALPRHPPEPRAPARDPRCAQGRPGAHHVDQVESCARARQQKVAQGIAAHVYELFLAGACGAILRRPGRWTF